MHVLTPLRHFLFLTGMRPTKHLFGAEFDRGEVLDAEFLAYEGSTSTAGTFAVGAEESGLRVTILNLIATVIFSSAIMPACVPKRPETLNALPHDLPESWVEPAPGFLPVTQELLDLIDSPQLRELVDEAMNNNPNLHATALRLEAARHRLSLPQSASRPSVSAGFTRGRTRSLSEFSEGEAITLDAHCFSLGVSWELDLWGKLADGVASAELEYQAQSHELVLARDALAARVIQGWFRHNAARRLLALEKRRLEVFRAHEGILIDRYKNGIGNLDELSGARTRAKLALADVSAREATLSESIRSLELLLGRYPRAEFLTSEEQMYVLSPAVQVPAVALLQRPDIQAAKARVASAWFHASSAAKARLPNLTLSGQVFRESTQISGLGKASSQWSILGSLFQPLLEGNRLAGESRAAQAEADAALEDLRDVVLRAINEVENALSYEHHLVLQEKALNESVYEAEKSSQYYEERYRQGLDPLQSLLITREQEMSIKSRLIEVQSLRLVNRIDLALALGCGLIRTQDTAEGEPRS